jgi:hypothetical protein
MDYSVECRLAQREVDGPSPPERPARAFFSYAFADERVVETEESV